MKVDEQCEGQECRNPVRGENKGMYGGGEGCTHAIHDRMLVVV